MAIAALLFQRKVLIPDSIRVRAESRYFLFQVSTTGGTISKVRVELTIDVSRETFSSAEPGDSVQLVVHPGAFSQPWYGDIILPSTRMSDSR
jgi:hypothetical protein